MIKTAVNPLFESFVSLINFCKDFDPNKAWDLFIHFPGNYEVWWTTLLKESPQHVLIETSLIIFIVWLLFIRRTVDPKKISKTEKLSKKEIDWLLDSWQPEPLAPPLNDTNKKLLSSLKVVEGVEGDYLHVRGVNQPVLNASSYDFLSFSSRPEVNQAVEKALDFYGCGSCGPRGFYGTLDQHLFLERDLAEFIGTEQTIVYSDGASAVISAIPAFCKKGDLLLVDEGCSEPVLTGVNLSRSTVRFFRHNDMKDLENILEAIRKEDIALKRDATQQRRFIVVEGTYRNFGDICPLPEIMALKEKYFYRLALDDTFSIGVLGKTGRGVAEHFGFKPSDIEVLTFTLDTVLSSVGGVCAGTREIVDHQRLSGAGYCYSASSAPFLNAGALVTLKLLQENPSVIENLQRVSAAVRDEVGKISQFSLVTNENTPIVHLQLAETFDIQKEKAIIEGIQQECIKHGLGLATSFSSMLKSHCDLRPTIKICVKVTWDSVQIKKLGTVLRAAAKKFIA